MRRGLVTFLSMSLAMLVVACGRSDDSVPSLQILSLEATGRVAEIVFIAEDDSGDPLDVTIDWGDRSQLERFSGSGELRSTHEYADDIDSPVVIVELTNSAGRSTRTARTLTMSAVTTTVAAAPTSSTSTTTSAPTTTSTTVPATLVTPATTTLPPTTTTSTTTTTSPPTTTTTPPTTTTAPPTTTSTTTTTEPEPEEYVVQLDFDTAYDVDRQTTGTYSTSDFTDSSASIEARTAGNNDDAFAGVVGVWRIPAGAFDDFGDTPSVSVYLETTSDVLLETGKNAGRGALFTIDLEGSVGGTNIGSGAAVPREIAEDDEFDDVVNDTIGFGTELDPDVTGDLVIALDIRCSAFGGTNIFQIGEQSRCLAEVDLDEFRVTITGG